jgi:hypothetical protein
VRSAVLLLWHGPSHRGQDVCCTESRPYTYIVLDASIATLIELPRLTGRTPNLISLHAVAVQLPSTRRSTLVNRFSSLFREVL